MESAGTVSAMPLPENLRPKQAEVIRLFESKDRVVAKLPTGYGKTITAAGSYASLRHSGKCNRMLFVVPRRGQAKQAADSLVADLETFGIKTKSIIVSDHPTQAFDLHRDGIAEVYVTTIQALITGKTFSMAKEMMEEGHWILVADEYHHYSQFRTDSKSLEDSVWADRLKSLKRSATLAMSATGKRFDGMDVFENPDVTETYVNAAKQNYVKELTLHAYEFHIEAVTINGITYTYSTDEFRAAVGSDKPEDVESFMADRQMKWSPKYITPLITFPLDRLIDNRLQGIKSQMLVQAMSVSHAKYVCDQIKTLVPKSMNVDWVGTGPNGRSDNENDAILAKFCPPKHKMTGRRKWTVDILVNVGMAGEGLDSTDVTEITFLSAANLNTSTLQIIGRGSRVMAVPKGVAKPLCHINVDSSSDIATYIGRKVMQVFDEEVVVAPESADHSQERDGEYELSPERMTIMVVDVRLRDIRSEPMFQDVVDDVKRGYPELTEEECAKYAEEAWERRLNRSNDESSLIEQMKQQIENLVSKISGLILQLRRISGLPVDSAFIGKLKKTINYQKKKRFGSVDDVTSDVLNAQYTWLREELEIPIYRNGLQGLPLWLR